MIVLSNEQTNAFDEIMRWFTSSKIQTFVLAGYAGVGKTTLAKYIADAIGDVHFCAYTGKAANVLREKGCFGATTIHGAIYELVSVDNDEPKFRLSKNSSIKHSKLVIVDEYSMLPINIINDLESFGTKILYLGDPFQLPPVDGVCTLTPDLFITEVHRQALDSPIIRYASEVRNGRGIPFCNHEEFLYDSSKNIPQEAYDNADQIIVGYNKTRCDWNDMQRAKLGFTGKYPNKGEKLICLKNNHSYGLFNGMIGESTVDAVHIGNNKVDIGFDAYGGDKFKSIKVWDGDFLRTGGYPPFNIKVERFDYAYAITCHKSQGSEFDNVVIYNQPVGKEKVERQRWLYTAITRGRNKVTLIEP